jgi:TrmH family RNA methyltransferase
LPSSSISPRARRSSILDNPIADHSDDWRDPADELVTSVANPAIRFARSLQRRRSRERERAALVEGVRAIDTALDFGARLRLLIVDAGRAGQLPKRELTRMQDAAGRVLYVADAPFASVADTEHPQPVIAVFELPSRELPHPATLVVALDAIRDPGNLGTLVRAALAAGADGLAMLPESVDVWNPKAIRASAGTIFGVAAPNFPDIGSAARQCFAARPAVVVADANAALSYDAFDWTQPVLLVVGGEAQGVGIEPRTYADVSVRIPMTAGVESLNAAVAGAVLLFEAARQRRGAE